MVIAQQLKAAREAAGLSRAVVADRAGISYEYLRLVESGQRRPTVAMLQRIALALGLRARVVLEWRGASEAS